MSGAKDDNDRLRDGELPDDPFAGTNRESSQDDNGAHGGPQHEGIDLDALRIGASLDEARSRISARTCGTEKPISTPWDSLDQAMGGGLWPGLHVVVGASGSGRSQFAHQVALHGAQHGTPVIYVALELDRLQLVCRFVGLVSDIRWSRIYLGEIDPDELRRVDDGLAQLADLPLFLEEGDPLGGWGHEQIAALGQALRQLADKSVGENAAKGTKPFLLVLDYLQLVSGDERELRERIGKAAYAARSVARSLNGVVVLISSTAREHYAALNGGKKANSNEGDGNPARFLGTGKESGEVEFAADSVLVFKRDPWDGDAPPPEGSIIRIGIAKLRAGAPSWVPLLFDGSRFTTLPKDWIPASAHGPGPDDDPAPF